MEEAELERWDAWSPAQAAAWLNPAGVSWAVAGGWALELFAGESWRAHEDLEIVVDGASFEAVRAALPALEWFVAGDGEVCPLDRAGAVLEQRWQTWGRDRDSGHWRVDVMRERWQSGEWLYRRDETIRRPLAEAIGTTSSGIPYLTPEAVLLFKAKHCRPKDQQDFAAVLPRLSADRRAWLAQALAHEQPHHPWLGALRAQAAKR